jgi:Ca2+-transporting ATPase
MPVAAPGHPLPPGPPPSSGAQGTDGLSEAEAARRLAADGRNELTVRPRHRLATAVWGQLSDTVILVLLLAAGMTAVVGDFPDMAVILAIIVLNTTLGTAQQMRSDQALAALSAMTAPRATVLRQGAARDIDAGDVVVGDLIELVAGDIVPADAVLIGCESFTVDESMLTGESVPVGRAVGEPVLAGSVVTRGHARAVVGSTAHSTVMGSIAGSLTAGPDTATPLQHQLSTLGRRLAAAAAVAAVVVALINLWGGRGWETSIVLGISLAVAAIPESLPAVVTLSLALAGSKLAGGGILVRKLSAVEALGSITVLAMDKTGTLTEGRMTVATTWTPTDSDPGRRRLLLYAALCSDACSGPELVPQRSDDPLEIALVVAATSADIDLCRARTELPRVSEVPFDALTAMMTTVHRDLRAAAGPAMGSELPPAAVESLWIRKGSPEALLSSDELDGPAGAALQRLTSDGFRVLAVSSGRTANDGAAGAADGQGALIGLVALQDPLRANAAAMVQAFRLAGVQPVMITGDHPVTAAAVGRALGLLGSDDVLVGGAVGTGAQAASLTRHGVIARVRPHEKTAVVRALQDAGNVVAMTGDGVNDAPALRAADIGIAMGAGTEVAKQAASIVLTSSDLSSMIPAIVEGRRVYDNITRFLRYALSGGTAEVLIMVFGPVLGMTIPLQAGQILFVNLLTHGLPGVAIGNEPATADAASRAPRSPAKGLLDRRAIVSVALLGSLIAVTSMAAAGWSAWHHRSGQSTLFVALTLAQLAVAISGRPSGHRLRDNRMLVWSVLINIALVMGAVLLPPLQELFRTRALTLGDLLACLVAALVVGALSWRLKAR